MMTNLDDLTVAQFNKRFGDRLKHRRKGLRIRQCDVADYAGVARATILNYEKGTKNPGCYDLYNTSRALSVSPGTLIDDIPTELGAFPGKEIEEFAMLMGLNISRFRDHYPLRQIDLADQCSITRQHLIRIESGKELCSAFVCYKLAKYLRVSTNDLMIDAAYQRKP